LRTDDETPRFGFTLIELLIVIIIIVLMATMSVALLSVFFAARACGRGHDPSSRRWRRPAGGRPRTTVPLPRLSATARTAGSRSTRT